MSLLRTVAVLPDQRQGGQRYDQDCQYLQDAYTVLRQGVL